MPSTFRGKAQVSGTKFVCDVILYPIAQSMKLTQQWETDIVQNEQGDDYAWRARNEKYEGDLGMVLVDKSSTSLAANAKTGAAFLAPLAILTISTCDVAAWNTTYQLMPGSDIDLGNTVTGKMGYKLQRYVDSTQNTLAATTPG